MRDSGALSLVSCVILSLQRVSSRLTEFMLFVNSQVALPWSFLVQPGSGYLLASDFDCGRLSLTIALPKTTKDELPFMRMDVFR